MRAVPLVLISVLSIFAFSAPGPALADQTLTKEYYTGGPIVTNLGFGLLVDPLDLDGDGQEDTPSIGGVSFETEQVYRNVIIGVSDDLWGAGGAFYACFWSHDGGVVQETYCSDIGCGTKTLLNSPFEGGRLKANMWALDITEDLEVCGASHGFASAHFF